MALYPATSSAKHYLLGGVSPAAYEATSFAAVYDHRGLRAAAAARAGMQDKATRSAKEYYVGSGLPHHAGAVAMYSTIPIADLPSAANKWTNVQG